MCALANDDGGNNEVAIAAAAAATINFLIVFMAQPPAKALTIFLRWPEHLRSRTILAQGEPERPIQMSFVDLIVDGVSQHPGLQR